MRRAALALVLALAGAAAAQGVLYKWTDAQGKVQYSDKPPKHFTGPVTKIETDAAPTPAALPKPAPAAPSAGDAEPKKDVPANLAATRRATRERLQADVDRARAKLEAAKKALEEGAEPEVEERQVIQQRIANARVAGPQQPLPNPDPASQVRAASGGMHGMVDRTNCRPTTGPDGKRSALCSATVLKTEYFDRIKALEDAVARAEEELARAQEAYRRGVD